LTLVSWLNTLHLHPEIALILFALKVLTPTLGIAGILASAYIYLVPARPAWNTPHTPIDFILSAAVLGSAAAPVLISATASIRAFHAFTSPSSTQSFPLWPLVLF
jgi:DMSO reductase anchor subunit